MKISKINNQQTFGIKCVNSAKWNPELLKKFEKSKLVSEIDATYPEASANYFLFKQNDLVNDENVWTLLFDLVLTPKKIWHYHLDSHFADVPDKYLADRINKLSLKDVENEIQKQASDGITRHQIKFTGEKENPIKEFFKRIFRKNS